MAALDPMPLDPAAATPADVVVARAVLLGATERTHLADAERLVDLRRLPPVPARYASLADPLPDSVWARLGIDALYTHQAVALDLVRAGRSTVLATSTASGKSLVAQAAIGEACGAPIRPGTTLCIYPTKALAHGQLRSLLDLGLPGVDAATYDGDADRTQRATARRSATVVLTNPEMLHCGLLPHHAGWVRFLARLQYVVVDEIHCFRGIFGSHVAHLLRRLRRVAADYGADPTFICASATVGDPAGLASALTGLDVTEVSDDGSPRGGRSVAIWNPPLLDPERGTRTSTHDETAGLVAELSSAGHPTIGFCPSRRSVETVTERVRRRVPAAMRNRVAVYRGGFLAEERIAVEDALAAGELDAVVATSALEVGIDVAGLDAVVLDGFPGTIAVFWQRAGRAGRRLDESLAVLVCGTDQLDQWIAAHPDALFDRDPEPVVVNPDNPHVADAHLLCAAFELPLTHADADYWPTALEEAICRLVGSGSLTVRAPGRGTAGGRGRRRRMSPTSPTAVWAGPGWPVDGVGLRAGGAGQVTIVDADDRAVGTVDRARAGQVVHEGAVYVHGGRHYRVTHLDLEGRRAVVVPDDGATRTVATTRKDLRVMHETRTVEEVGGVRRSLADIEVTTRVTGYERIDVSTGAHIDRVGLRLPPATLVTRGVVRSIPEGFLTRLGLAEESWPGVLHAAEHAAIGVLPLFAICDRWDVGGISTARHVDTGRPTIVIYDGHPGGSGVAELAFDVSAHHMAVTHDVIMGCGCRSGCPSCVQSPKCGNGNEPLDKGGAGVLLGALAGRPVAVSDPG